MPEVLISDIRASMPERQREDMGPIEELAKSIAEFGLLEPVILDDANNLIAGFRRLTACIALGHDRIKAEYIGQIDPVRAQEIELEENIQRHQLSWQEESKAVARIHQMKMVKDPLWTADKTAEALNMSRRKVFNSVALADAVDQHPDVARAETQAGAMLRLGQIKQITQRVEDAKVRILRQELNLAPKTTAEIKQGDALALLKTLPADYADFMVSNPPYGVDIESVFIGERTIYKDEEKNIVPLLYQVAQEVYRVLKPDKWFVFFYPTARLEEGKDILRKAGFAFQEVPCVWYKPNKFMSALSNPYQTFSSQYETFFWAAKGKPKFVKLRLGNVFVYDTPEHSDRLHPLQMPIGLWKEIIEIGSVGGELVVEPFSGSGSCGVACVQTERSYVGLELSQEYAERSRAWISEAFTGQTSATVALESDDETPSGDVGTFDQLKNGLEFKE